MKPTKKDLQSFGDYRRELNEFLQRGKFIDGLHVNDGYTKMAQLFLIKQMIKTDKWRVVSDAM